MSVWASEDGRTAETSAYLKEGVWVPVVKWKDSREFLPGMASEASAIALADRWARRILHPWYRQEEMLVSPLQSTVADNEG